MATQTTIIPWDSLGLESLTTSCFIKRHCPIFHLPALCLSNVLHTNKCSLRQHAFVKTKCLRSSCKSETPGLVDLGESKRLLRKSLW